MMTVMDAIKGCVALDDTDLELFDIVGDIQPQNLIKIVSREDGEVRFEELSTLADPDYYRSFKDLAFAQAYQAKAKKERDEEEVEEDA